MNVHRRTILKAALLGGSTLGVCIYVRPAWARLTGPDELRLDRRTFNVFGDGLHDDSPGIVQWLDAQSEYRKPGLVPSGTYLIHGNLTYALTKDISIKGQQKAIFKGTPGTGYVLRFDGGQFRPALRLYGLTVDNSQREFVNAAPSGTALSLIRLKRYAIDSCAAVSLGDYRLGKGDSGITVNSCDDGSISNSYFRGQPDLGVYVTGGPGPGPEDDSNSHLITNCVFEYCAGAGSAKRQVRNVSFRNNLVKYCRTGFANAPASSRGQRLDPGRNIVIEDNCFYKIGSRAAVLRHAETISFRNNVVVDWGADPDGRVSEPGMNRALQILGVRGGIISNNRFILKDWKKLEHLVGIELRDVELPSGAYTSTGCRIENNRFENINVGIWERGNSSGNFGTNSYANVKHLYLSDSKLQKGKFRWLTS